MTIAEFNNLEILITDKQLYEDIKKLAEDLLKK